MTPPDESETGPETGTLVPAYVIANARELPKGSHYSLTTLVTAAPEPPRQELLDPERTRLLDICSGGYLTVAELAGHTQLPVGVVRILLADLIDRGYVQTRAPVPAAQRVDTKILEEVLHGLEARFG